jgi:hypothetical protein
MAPSPNFGAPAMTTLATSSMRSTEPSFSRTTT